MIFFFFFPDKPVCAAYLKEKKKEGPASLCAALPTWDCAVRTMLLQTFWK